MGRLIFVCGTHTSGKSSILKMLEVNKVISKKGTEIGKELYYKRKFNTEEQGEEFEKEIANLELKRDMEIKSEEGLIAVETWHPGNLAYADIRNEKIVPEIIEKINKSPFMEDAIGIWLRIPKSEIIKRTKTFEDKKEWAGNFYEEIDRKIGKYLEKLNLLDNTYIVDDNKNFEDVYKEVEKIIKNI